MNTAIGMFPLMRLVLFLMPGGAGAQPQAPPVQPPAVPPHPRALVAPRPTLAGALAVPQQTARMEQSASRRPALRRRARSMRATSFPAGNERAPVRTPFDCAIPVMPGSSRVVHFEFNRVRCVFEADHLRHLQLDIAVDEIVVE